MRISKALVYALMLSFAFMQTAPAIASIVSTDSILAEQSIQQDREKLYSLMARDEVRSLLQHNGLTVEQAQKRVDVLTDSEVRQLAKQFEELPAAGGGAVLGIVVALVVVILELAGITDIFTAI